METKALISFAVTAKLICVFVFAYAKGWFSHNEAHIVITKKMKVEESATIKHAACHRYHGRGGITMEKLYITIAIRKIKIFFNSMSVFVITVGLIWEVQFLKCE